MIATTETVLDYMQVAVAAQLPPGLHRQDLRLVADATTERLTAQLSAFVMTQPAGNPVRVSRTISTTVPYRPRWCPRWLWRRVPERHDTRAITLAAFPKFTYPSATIAVPALGAPVKFVTTDVHDTFA